MIHGDTLSLHCVCKYPKGIIKKKGKWDFAGLVIKKWHCLCLAPSDFLFQGNLVMWEFAAVRIVIRFESSMCTKGIQYKIFFGVGLTGDCLCACVSLLPSLSIVCLFFMPVWSCAQVYASSKSGCQAVDEVSLWELIPEEGFLYSWLRYSQQEQIHMESVWSGWYTPKCLSDS